MASGTIEKKFHGGSTGGYYFGIEWSATPNASTNSSSVTAKVFIRSSGSGYTISSSATKNITLSINGTSYSGTATVGLGTNATKVLLTKTVTVPHNSDGTKTCSFSCSGVLGLTLSGTYYGTVSHSGSGTLDKINLNTAPYWGTNDDTHIQLNGTAIKSHVIIPENTGNVTVVACAASDKETPNALHYDIHRYVNGNYSAKIKSGGNGRTVVDNLSSWGQGTQFKYVVKVHDGSLWVSNPASRVSWTYTKNTFTRASVDSIGSIGINTTKVGFRAHSIKNSGGGNGYVSNNFGYRIESLTSGVTIGGNATHKQENANAVSFELGVKNNGETPTNPHWLDANQLRTVLRDSNYCGNIRLRLVSWNDYGSQGVYDFNIWVDLRKAAPTTTVKYDANNYITYKSTNYYIPAHLPFKVTWNAVNDTVEGYACSYELYYQIGSGSYVYLGSTTSTSYTAYLGSTAIGNTKQTEFRIVVRVKTRYGYYLDSFGTRITLWDYAPPTVKITETSRNQGSAVAKGTITVNSSIPNITLTNTHWRWLNGSNTKFKASTTDQKVNNFTITATINDDFAGTMHVASSDSVRDLIEAKVTMYWDSAETTFKGYMPVMSLNRYGLGVGTRLENSSYKFAVDGNANIIGNLHINGSPISNKNILSRGNVTCETGTNRPALNGVSMSQVYNNGYPTTYGNVLTLKGSGDGQLLVGWSGTSGAHAPVYVRSKRDTSDASWSGWAQIYTTANKPTPGDIGAASSSHSHSYLPLGGGTMTGLVQLPNYGGSWLNGATNACLKGSKQSTGSYHPIICQTTSGNHKISLGGLGDEFGFYMYDASRTANGIDKYFRFHLSDKTLRTDCRTFINEWLYFPSGYGIYFNGNDGGFYMQDTTWVRIYGNKSLYSTGTARITSAEHRYIRGNDNGSYVNIDMVSYDGKCIAFNPSAGSGANILIDRAWSGSSGTEPSFRINKGNGWGFIGNSGTAFYRVYGAGGSVSDRTKKYEILKADTETQYENVKDLNIYNYRTISTIDTPIEEIAKTFFEANFIDVDGSYITASKTIDGKEYKELDENLSQEEIKELRIKEIIEKNPNFGECKREDLSLGCMIDEMPLETTFYDNEGGDGKAVDMYSYTTMILGATKHLIAKVETLEKENEELRNKINKTEEILDGIINKG